MNQDPNMNQNNFNNDFNQPMQGQAPMPGPMPMQGQAPMPEPMPMPGQTPMPGPMPMPGQTPMPEPMPMQGQTPMPGPMPMPGQTPMPGPMPMPGQQPAMQQNQNPYQMPSQQYNGLNQQPQNKKLNPVILIVPIVIVAIIVGILLLSGGNSYKKPIELYCEGLSNLDASKINEALPEELIKDMGYDMTEEIQYMKDTLTTYNATLSVTCDIGEGEKLTKEELQSLTADFQSEYNTTRTISKAYYVKVARTTNIKYSGGNDNSETENVTITVGKIDGKWYYLDE